MRKIIFTLIFFGAIFCADAQLTITRIKGKAGTYSDDLSYPRVSSKKTRVVNKIDSVLPGSQLPETKYSRRCASYFTK